MNKSEIEHFLSVTLNDAVTAAVSASISELNGKGFAFEPVHGLVMEWTDPGSGFRLAVHCSLGVQLNAASGPSPVSDPVMESFFARVDSGEDPEAEMLSSMEGEISNGGFLQLFDNRGPAFMAEAALLLERIGSREALSLVRRAGTLIEKNAGLLGDYDAFRKKLFELDKRYYDMKESPVALFEKFRGGR